MLQNNAPKSFLLFFFSTSQPYLHQYDYIPLSCLATIAGIAVFAIIIWCIIRTFKILNSLNNKTTSGTFNTPDSVKSDTEKHRQATYPTYPSGWYPLCWSHEVQKGQVIQRNVLGRHYAIFRGDINGEIGVLDAFCPHLGSNLTVGGKVCNDALQCPFHLWKFDKNGVCKDIPYLKKSSKIPNNANAKSYPSTEYHGMVCVYYNNNTENNKECKAQSPTIPSYNLPIQHDLLNENEYKFVDSLDYGLVNMHIQEFAENAADWMHFGPIHGKMMFPFSQCEIPILNKYMSIHHEPATHVGGGVNKKDSQAIQTNNYGPDNKYFLYFINKSHLKWNGKSIPNSNGNANITFCGPAGVCIFKMSMPAFPNQFIYLFHTHLPEDKMNLRVRFHWYSHKKLPGLLVWYVVGNWISQWTNDIAIWENKILLKKPCLVRGDGPIFKVRRWWRQFYPKEDNDKQKNKVVINSGNNNEDKNEQEVKVVENDVESEKLKLLQADKEW